MENIIKVSEFTYKVGPSVEVDMGYLKSLMAAKKWFKAIKFMKASGLPIELPKENFYAFLKNKDWKGLEAALWDQEIFPRAVKTFPESICEMPRTTIQYDFVIPCRPYCLSCGNRGEGFVPEVREVMFDKAISRIKKQYIWLLKEHLQEIFEYKYSKGNSTFYPFSLILDERRYEWYRERKELEENTEKLKNSPDSIECYKDLKLFKIAKDLYYSRRIVLSEAGYRYAIFIKGEVAGFSKTKPFFSFKRKYKEL